MASGLRPHVVLVVADDMGYSDLGCYGGEVATPTLDRLGRAGVRLSRFYNTARCSPSRASLLTGLHPHQTGLGILTNDDRPQGYPGSLNRRCVTLAEMLRQARSWRLEDLDRVLDSVNAADIATKTTGSPDQLIAERLLLEIAARARRLGL